MVPPFTVDHMMQSLDTGLHGDNPLAFIDIVQTLDNPGHGAKPVSNDVAEPLQDSRTWGYPLALGGMGQTLDTQRT